MNKVTKPVLSDALYVVGDKVIFGNKEIMNKATLKKFLVQSSVSYVADCLPLYDYFKIQNQYGDEGVKAVIVGVYFELLQFALQRGFSLKDFFISVASEFLAKQGEKFVNPYLYPMVESSPSQTPKPYY